MSDPYKQAQSMELKNKAKTKKMEKRRRIE
jgi:hypothetical protein